MSKSGVIYVAYGAKALSEAKASAATLPKNLSRYIRQDGKEAWEAHQAKTRAYKWSPFRHTLMLDADTRVRDWEALSVGFRLLEAGIEVVMVPSWPPSKGRVLWSLTAPDRDYTFQVLGMYSHIMLNTGVLFFSKTKRVQLLFEAWEEEWSRFSAWDQGAFLRALYHNPVTLCLLGKAFNSRKGSVVEHRFGHAR